VQLTGTVYDQQDPPNTHSSALFHICREALANAAKHVKAKIARIAAWITDDRPLMEVGDDGKGFDMEKINMNIGHGLANMQTREGSMGSDVDISSVMNEGRPYLHEFRAARVDKPKNSIFL